MTLEIGERIWKQQRYIWKYCWGMYVDIRYTSLFASMEGAKRPAEQSEARALMSTEAPLLAHSNLAAATLHLEVWGHVR